MSKPKKNRKNAREVFVVLVTYPASLYPKMDNKIFKAAKQRAEGSGFGLDQRDHSWTRKTKRGAEALVARLKKLRNVTIDLGREAA